MPLTVKAGTSLMGGVASDQAQKAERVHVYVADATGGSMEYRSGARRATDAAAAAAETEGGRRRTNWGEAANGQRLAGVKSAEAGPRSPLQFGRWPAGRRRRWLLHGRHSDGLTQKPSGWANGDGPRRCPEIALQ